MSSTMVKDYYKKIITLNEEYISNLNNLLIKLERGRSDGSIDTAMQSFHQIELVLTSQKIGKLRNELSHLQSEGENEGIDNSPLNTSKHFESSSTICGNDVNPQLHFGEDAEKGVSVQADSPSTPNQQEPRPPAPLYSLLDVEFGPTGMVCVKKMNGAIFVASGYPGIWLLRRSDSTRHCVSDTPESHSERNKETPESPESPDAQSTKTDGFSPSDLIANTPNQPSLQKRRPPTPYYNKHLAKRQGNRY